ncbi:MAG: PH domain-containing protein [Maioricimonas sp. JB049]
MSTRQKRHVDSDRLVYTCPHCDSDVEVHEGQLGEIIDCPNPKCGRPFEVPAPNAHLASRQPGEGGTRNVLKAGLAADIEHDILVRHPAMFRNNPFTYIGVLILIFGGVAGALIFTAELPMVGMASGVAALVGIALMAGWYVQVLYRTLTITNKRTIYRQGLISRRTNEVQHDDVRNIQVNQGILDRLLGVGRIAISSSGQDDMEIDVKGIPHPDGIAETIRTYQ